MRKAVLGAALALIVAGVLGGGSATAFHGSSTCSSLSGTALANRTPTPGSVASGQTKVYTVTVPAGQEGDVAVLMAGDVDMAVCKTSTNADYCGSDLIAGVPDACSVGGWDLDGKTLTPGTYKVQVKNCFDAACGYADGLPAVNYVITFAHTGA